ncbi:hypothetical protein COW46_02655 [Candidatus Gracilibacteria bacterium CG17_big_fil_post_rev_8_21_14_2_50_48_13]|nr:MAG: hypothetical protein COW46_02655 [Candidatus Gracilibacteria bacterium CG17_big_fil_post_rev_8_21_14_2_50_48_13]
MTTKAPQQNTERLLSGDEQMTPTQLKKTSFFHGLTQNLKGRIDQLMSRVHARKTEDSSQNI